MPSLTLVALSTEELAVATTALARARSALGDAQAEVRAAEHEHRAAHAHLAQRKAAEAGLRRDLSAAADDMPADALGLAQDVEHAIVLVRIQAAAVSLAQRRLADARRGHDVAGGLLRERDADFAAATAAMAAAEARAARLEAARSALAVSPLTGVKAAAGGALSGQALQDADARLATDIPADLLARARARLAIVRAELGDAAAVSAAAAEASVAAATTQAGRSRATAGARSSLEAAEQTSLATLDGRRDLERAQAAVAAVTATPPLSDDRLDRIASLQPDASVIGLEEDRDDKREVVRSRRRVHDDKRLAALVADPDADPADDSDVRAALAQLGAAQDDLRDAEAALDVRPAAGEPTPREAFGRWEAAVPDEMWAALAALEAARATLARLDATTPGDLRAVMAAAEDGYAQALRAEATGNRAAAALAALAVDRAAAADVLARTTSDLSTVRGDA